jgi:HK97 gp10 family phage protein
MTQLTVKIEGLSQLQTALSQFAKSTQRAILERTLKKVAAPVADTARRDAPVDTGRLKESIVIEVVRTNAGKTAFAEAIRGGSSREEAGQAARAANRAAAGRGQSATVRVRAKSAHALFVEFGTVKMSARPFLGPAPRSNRDGALSTIKTTLGKEIDATAKRVAARKAKKAGS